MVMVCRHVGIDCHKSTAGMIALGTLAHKVHCKTHICKLCKVSHQCNAGSGKASEQGTAVIRIGGSGTQNVGAWTWQDWQESD